MIEKIKAEIERQSERNTKLFQDGAISVEALTARDSQLMIIRTFIESLEKEQEVNLEKEIEDYYHTNLGFILSPVDTRIIVEEIARHFYELGCRHAAVLYDDMEKKETPDVEDALAKIGAMVAAEQRCDHEEEYTKTKRK